MLILFKLLAVLFFGLVGLCFFGALRTTLSWQINHETERQRVEEQVSNAQWNRIITMDRALQTARTTGDWAEWNRLYEEDQRLCKQERQMVAEAS